MKNTRLVYASDGSHEKICKTCGELKCVCQKAQEVLPAETQLKIRLEKKGRGGKSVTVVFELPHNPDYFKKLSKKLKSHVGTGGAFKENQIELQGDQREKTRVYLEKLGFSVKLSGG